MSKTYIEIDLQLAGQPRPYADSIYQGTVKIEYDSVLQWSPTYHYAIPRELKPTDLDPTKTFVHTVRKPMNIGDEAFKVHYSRLLYPWKENPEWHEPRLAGIRKLADGIWEVTVTVAYTD